MKVIISLLSNAGRRPLSRVVEIESIEQWNRDKAKIKQNAIATICANRHMTMADLKKYGYTIIQTQQYKEKEQ